jgi:hypothetical protein
MQLNQLPEEAQMTIARKLGYDGKKDGFPAYLMSNRRIADRYTQLENAFQAQQRRTTGMSNTGMAEGGYMMERFSQNQQQDMVGGYVPPPKQSFANGGSAQPIDYFLPGTNPPLAPGETRMGEVNPAYTGGQLNVMQQVPQTAPTPTPTVPSPIASYDPNATIGDISTQMTVAPGLPQGAEVQTVTTTPTTDQMLQSGVGQVSGQVALPTAQAGTTTATPQTTTQANQLQAQAISPQVTQAVNTLEAAQGTVGTQAQSVAQQQTTSSVSDLTAAQGTATQMVNPVQRQIQAGELIDTTANAEKAKVFTEQIEAASATPTEKATVAGQLATLTANFDASNPPAWAAGSLRAVQAQMAQRGLGASSMAGQAMIQAALESALPIAQADAQVQASFESANLSNRQQRAMLAAQQRANFIGLEFDQAFQSRVQNSAKIADIANRNFTAEQQVALENSRSAQTMNLNNLTNRQAITMAEASALANLDMSNLNNRQQSAVQNAQSFLQMDMANLSNQQQVDMFAGQQQVQSMFTDQAAENASRQFNATSQNQVDQFFASLGQQANQFNATQMNAQEQFNAGQANTIERFNAEINNQRDQFNAQNQTVIAQSNAQWRRQLATEATANTNRANELNAQNILGISNQAYNNLWQYYGDTMEWAWTSAENERSRVIELAMAQLQADSATDIQKMKDDTASSTAFGSLIGKFVTGSMFGGGGGLFG